jgi:hypothetical protein
MKKSPIFLLGVLLLLLNISVDVLMLSTNLGALGVLSLTGSSLVFCSATIWFIYRDEVTLKFRNSFAILPLALFVAAFLKFLKAGGIKFQPAAEDLAGVGNMLMARYEMGLWIISAWILLTFVISGSILIRRIS